jgi:ABC-type transport system involved in multi-copper enzyme maturation permease subunit
MKWRAVAINTFREAIRDKILYTLLIFSFALILASILPSTVSIGERTKLIIDFALASINLVGVLMAIFLGVGLVSNEIERKSLYTVLVKPIGRGEFLVGKYAGLLMTLAVNTIAMGVVLYLTLMIEEFRWGESIWNLPPRLGAAIGMIYLELALLTAIALLFSTFTTTVLAATFTFSLYIIGHLNDDLVAMGETMEPGPSVFLLKGLYYLLPNLSNFDIKGKVTHGVPIELGYYFLVVCYAVVYCTLLIGIATFIFKRRDLK